MRNQIDAIDTIAAPTQDSGTRFGGAIGRVTKAAVNMLLSWQQRARERHRLASFDEHMLRDLGLSRADIEFELRKPFWRP